MTDRAREHIARLLEDAFYWSAADAVREGRSVFDATRYIVEDPKGATRLHIRRAVFFSHASLR